MNRTDAERAEGARRAGDLAVTRGRWTPEQRADLERELLEEEVLRSARATATERDRETANPADQLAAEFHTAYEQLAPDYGYVTQPESAVPWADVPEPNRSLMIHVARLVLMGPTLAAERARVLAPIQALITELAPLLAAGHDVSGRDLLDRLHAAIEETSR